MIAFSSREVGAFLTVVVPYDTLQRKGVLPMSVFETMVLMIAFATLVVTIIDHKK
ncbi:hypothetical protein F3157_08615 [Virgibacillus dakarensis]|uniref:Uncharacterized protein n=1 Tax=Lentibacillus populi TaxID=1827502 RepID=A0A9W5TZ77_9BACI|nr:hypothetical protein [Virgibacillus dakarensis]GGB46062.1 hypothetical protein GCM10011409_24540 [Lentibacillus populi]